MLCDHIAVAFIDSETLFFVMRAIGRISFPIFLFLLSVGYMHTGSIRRYIARVFLCACVSEIPYQLVFSGELSFFSTHNTLFTYAAVLLMLVFFDRMKGRFAAALKCGVVLIFTVAGIALDLDYADIAFVLAALMRIFAGKKLYTAISVICLNLFSGVPNMFAGFAAIPIALYDGGKGGRLPRFFFYVFYPAHLAVIAAVMAVFMQR